MKLLWDLKDARERLKANSQTSSRPPRSDPPWHSHDSADEDVDMIDAEGGETESEAESSAASPAAEAEFSAVTVPAVETTPVIAADKKPKKDGRQVGAPGQGRQMSLPGSATVNHRPETCVCCGQALDAAEFIARTGLYVLEIETDPAAGLRGLQVCHEKPVPSPCWPVSSIPAGSVATRRGRTSNRYRRPPYQPLTPSPVTVGRVS